MTLINLLACEEAAEVQGLLASSGAAIVPLVRLLLHSFPVKTQERAIETLLTLIASSDGRSRAIAAAGGIPPLVRLLDSGPAKARLLAVTLLHLMAVEGTPADLMAMEAAGVLPVLAKLQGASTNRSEMTGFISGLLSMLSSVRSGGSTGSAGSASAHPSSIPSAAAATSDCGKPDGKPASTAREKMLCWFCGATGVPLKKCSVCVVAAYCGAACQKADWKAHKGQCAGLKATVAACKE